MASLDMSDAFHDPMILDWFNVQRRTETVGTNGRSTISTRVYQRINGIVTMSSPSDMDRRTDYQVTTRTISVVSKFKMQTEVTGFQPDIVVWRGDNYVVKHVDYYPQFGSGFYQAECESIDLTDVNPAMVRV